MKKKDHLLPLLLFVFMLFRMAGTHAQDSLAGKWIDINKVNLVTGISKRVYNAYLPTGAELSGVSYSSIKFQPGVIHGYSRIPSEFVTRRALLRFNLFNSADSTMGVYFFPGLYYRDIRPYRLVNDTLEALPRILPPISDSIGFRYISLGAHDSATIVVEMAFLRTYINTLRPRLLEADYVEPFVADMTNTHAESEWMTYVFCGLLLMMILFSLASFVHGANKEFLYYSGYAFFIGLMLLTKAMFTFRISGLSFFLEEYFDFILQSLGIIFYMIFMQKYLDTKKDHPFLYKLYNSGIVMLLAAIACITWLHYFTGNFQSENIIENTTKIFLLFMTLIFVVYSFRHRQNKMMWYLFWGNLCLFVFALFSQLIILSWRIVQDLTGIFSSALFYYELGLFLELVFFLIALSYKNNSRLVAEAREFERLRAENQMKEYEKELAVFKAQQQERERISADIHDELGSGMTAIRLMSEIARGKLKDNVPAEIDKISHSADEVLNKMNAIIWSMNSGNDTLDNLISYIRAYTLEYFENTPIECNVSIPDNIGERELTGDKRRNIFLCIKETLNNTLKHSGATQVRIDFFIGEDIMIKIADNGIGIDLKKIRQFGNGLKNITRRMESIGGVYAIENNHGTVTTLTLPV